MSKEKLKSAQTRMCLSIRADEKTEATTEYLVCTGVHQEKEPGMSEGHENDCRIGSPVPFSRVVVVCGSGGDSSPVYSVVVNGDGQVLYKGRCFVVQAGRHEWRLSEDRIQAIALAIQDSDVLTLRKSESNSLTKNFRLVVAIRLPGAKPVVVDNVGDAEALEGFVARIGKLAGLHGYAHEL
jgi:hypothetical protein